MCLEESDSNHFIKLLSNSYFKLATDSLTITNIFLNLFDKSLYEITIHVRTCYSNKLLKYFYKYIWQFKHSIKQKVYTLLHNTNVSVSILNFYNCLPV